MTESVNKCKVAFMNYDFSRAFETLKNRRSTKTGVADCPRCKIPLIRRVHSLKCPDCSYQRDLRYAVELPTNEFTMCTITLGEWNRCIYCGELPESRDHVIPFSMFDPGKTSGSKPGPKVICCKDCNSRLNDRFFGSLTLRAQAAQGCIRRKASKIMRTGNWTKSEIARLDPSLRTFVSARHFMLIQAEKRLEWQETAEYTALRAKIRQQVRECASNNLWLRDFVSD